jgi:hypothetical protein
MILLYTFIAIIAFISWWINYVPKMPLKPQETVKKCPFCLKAFDGDRFFVDCNGNRFIYNKSHQFTIYGRSNFYLYIYCNEFTIKLEKMNSEYTLRIKDKSINVPPFEICQSIDVIVKYLKLISFS